MAALPALNADPHVDAITAEIGDATLSGNVGVNAPSFSESGWGTTLTVSEAFIYGGAFTQGLGSTLSISSGDQLSLTGTANLSGTTSGARDAGSSRGERDHRQGRDNIRSQLVDLRRKHGRDAQRASQLPGLVQRGRDDTFFLSGGNLVLSGAATFAGGTVDGSKILYTK